MFGIVGPLISNTTGLSGLGAEIPPGMIFPMFLLAALRSGAFLIGWGTLSR
jgi:hypothetical protein